MYNVYIYKEVFKPHNGLKHYCKLENVNYFNILTGFRKRNKNEVKA